MPAPDDHRSPPLATGRLGFPVHALVGAVPLGIFVVASLFDLGSHLAEEVRFARPAFWAVCGGVAVGVLAGIPGLLDARRLPAGSPARALAVRHTVVTDLALLLGTASALLRRDTDPSAPVAALPMAASALALATLVVGASLGARLTYGFGVGVAGRDQNSG